MARVSSDIGAAQVATSGVESVNIGSKKTVNFSQSNISGMNAGKNVANQMLGDLEKLINCVKTQAGKFKQLAAVREEMDAADQTIFKKK
ncbi:hypothetical protein [Lactococcus allomyrinae]|uniref:TIGR04197 family type VII secretion effector n=1 Tax=Lactococcus allomyrinae TaxID=2419773 RepID=A0A387BD94_9LACT|nr:hypothetical protein [Lactococcus allomyrinae]AYG00468.1 hypothetical protein D7I46_04810 [Lactococcus allomyrinae]